MVIKAKLQASLKYTEKKLVFDNTTEPAALRSFVTFEKGKFGS